MATSSEPGECLSEDELYALAHGALADDPHADAHLASCGTCAALVAGALRGRPRAWDALAGTHLGPYRLDAQLGAGGMGAVYRAWDERLGRAIAVKVLHAERRATQVASEARAAAAIDHRAIVRIYDVGEVDGLAYIAMELVTGTPLRASFESGGRRGGLGVSRARELLVELVDALVAAHACGVVHRDLKPENLLVARDGLRVLDFGLARRGDDGTDGDGGPGIASGTAGYMAPEQTRGEPGDVRADLFAVGAIGYELVTGRRAFPGATTGERLAATLRDTPTLDELGALAPVIGRCLAKDPVDRFQSAADLAWGIHALATPTTAAAPRRISRRALVIGGAAASAGVLASGVLGFALGRGRRHRAPSPLVLRPLSHRTGRVYNARFTHDGARVAVAAAWDDDPLVVQLVELASREISPLGLASANVLAISPRGEVAAALDYRFVDHQSARGRLVMTSLSGETPRPIADDIQDADFVPDHARFGSPGGELAVIRGREHGFTLELPLGNALVTDPGWITHARISPDGARVAYLRHPQVDDDAGDLVVVDRATRLGRTITADWDSIAGLAWDPAGDALWFTGSHTTYTNQLHRVTLAGEVTAPHAQTASRLRLHDLAADRRALVTEDAWRLRAMAGTRDVSMSEVSYVAEISSDGTQVVVGELGQIEAGTGAYLVPYAGGKPLRLGPGYPVALSPSGLKVAANIDAKDHLVVYATGSGDAPAIPTPGFVTFARWLDERALIARFQQRLWRLEIGASPRPLAGTADSFALDPARSRCAFVDPAGTLHVLDVASGQLRELARGFTRTEVCGWLAAPDAIVVRSTTTPIVLDRIDPATGARTRHAEIQPPKLGLKAVDSFVVSADGTRYAYSYGVELSQLFLTSSLA